MLHRRTRNVGRAVAACPRRFCSAPGVDRRAEYLAGSASALGSRRGSPALPAGVPLWTRSDAKQGGQDREGLVARMIGVARRPQLCFRGREAGS